MENKLIQVILDRIAIVSKEVKRTFVVNPEAQLEAEVVVVPTEAIKTVMKLPTSVAEDETKKKPITKKGIGYGSDNTG